MVFTWRISGNPLLRSAFAPKRSRMVHLYCIDHFAVEACVRLVNLRFSHNLVWWINRKSIVQCSLTADKRSCARVWESTPPRFAKVTQYARVYPIFYDDSTKKLKPNSKKLEVAKRLFLGYEKICYTGLHLFLNSSSLVPRQIEHPCFHIVISSAQSIYLQCLNRIHCRLGRWKDYRASSLTGLFPGWVILGRIHAASKLVRKDFQGILVGGINSNRSSLSHQSCLYCTIILSSVNTPRTLQYMMYFHTLAL